MTRSPPTLSYLAIYNPSLRPSDPNSIDDEDAEEQAHILFYTSRERAASRDRMLRQIGLAKALVNFTEMFNAEEVCANVHSQSRRILMVCPEPDFWINAVVEVAKVPRVMIEKGKPKGKDKGKGKEKSKEPVKAKEPPVVYDYQDGSVNDLALRAYILRGYEQFKLTHGSFTTILSTVGQQALELQLERFFTVWAWSWNLEEEEDFGDYLGNALHPRQDSLIGLIDDFEAELPAGCVSILVDPPFVLPSTKFTAMKYPPSLSRYFLSIVPPEQTLQSNEPANEALEKLRVTESTMKVRRPQEPHSTTYHPIRTEPSHDSEAATSNTFLGMPTIGLGNMNVNMDLRTWSWPDYLTFGRSHGKKSAELKDKDQTGREVEKLGQSDTEESNGEVEETQGNGSLQGIPDIKLDQNALEDSISSAASGISSTGGAPPSPTVKLESPITTQLETLDVHAATHIGIPAPSSDPNNPTTQSIEAAFTESTDEGGPFVSTSASPTIERIFEPPLTVSSPPMDPLPEFSSLTVHLAEDEDAAITQRHKVLYITRQHKAVLLLGLEDKGGGANLPSVMLQCLAILDNLQNVVEGRSSGAAESPITATKILQPRDKYIITTSRLKYSSPGFVSTSEHLFNGQQLLEKDLEILEVFSRGQNPQHWHIARRGLGTDVEGLSMDGDVYMEVCRKEASLTDVDNELAGIVRRFVERTG